MCPSHRIEATRAGKDEGEEDVIEVTIRCGSTTIVTGSTASMTGRCNKDDSYYVKASIEDNEKERNDLRAELEVSRREIHKLKNNLKMSKSSNHSLQNQIVRLSVANGKLRDEAEEYQSKFITLKDRLLRDLQNTEAFGCRSHELHRRPCQMVMFYNDDQTYSIFTNEEEEKQDQSQQGGGEWFCGGLDIENLICGFTPSTQKKIQQVLTKTPSNDGETTDDMPLKSSTALHLLYGPSLLTNSGSDVSPFKEEITSNRRCPHSSVQQKNFVKSNDACGRNRLNNVKEEAFPQIETNTDNLVKVNIQPSGLPKEKDDERKKPVSDLQNMANMTRKTNRRRWINRLWI